MSFPLRFDPMVSIFPCLVDRKEREVQEDSIQSLKSPRLACELQNNDDVAPYKDIIGTDDIDRLSVITMPGSQTKDMILPALKSNGPKIDYSKDAAIQLMKTKHRCDTIHDNEEDFSVDQTHDDMPSVEAPKRKRGKTKAPKPLSGNDPSARKMCEVVDEAEPKESVVLSGRKLPTALEPESNAFAPPASPEPTEHGEASRTEPGEGSLEEAATSELKLMWIRVSRALYWLTLLGILASVGVAIWHIVTQRDAKHVVAWASAAFFVAVAVVVALHNIHLHVLHYLHPLQRFYIRVVWMVPIYAIESWLALRFVAQRAYLEASPGRGVAAAPAGRGE